MINKDRPGSKDVSDTELIIQAQRGSMSAFEQLVQRYDRRVLTIAASFVSTSDDAKDIYQEVFLRVFKGLRSFERRSEFSTWLYRITTNVCLTHRSRARKYAVSSIDAEREVDGQPTTLKDSIAGDSAADRRAIGSEIAAHVEEAMDELSPQQRTVFTLRHYEGYKLKEIATMMDVSEGTVKKYLFDATARMRDKLKHLVSSARETNTKHRKEDR
ncbi:MAG TPA: RNA polymerase sigma factor [Bacteroidota bacterium]|nr:RNA polymerase sigma factor [Bacteroidota bacterium]